ncbi:MAG: Glycosyltransferase [Hydrogenibacillus schlegelii]|uniref:Glycosyltransferase n=1 Tax=Hydrogenibacillus schlegelii TaxID=1484 RepID=A0A2T5G7V3_HYDSH|nr:glycosyltransferase family 2 protein [Hydrogenibacillus schlegelii]PTQ52239.1 MAG: Glycosyltransferase [Hydrogenibacillus schlegelii]
MKAPVLAVVVPCHNEEGVLPQTAGRLREALGRLSAEGLVDGRSFLLFVDDGSTDGTWAIIERLFEAGDAYGLRLSRNFGQQAALLAGYRAVRDRADAAISIDADLQDDPGAMREMVLRFLEGYDVVYGARRMRDSDRWFKRATARAFYRLMRALGVGIVPDHAHFRLLSRRALSAVLRFREADPFLRGIVPLAGFRQTVVYYDRLPRTAGESKYSLRKLVDLAVSGITSFSIRPIRFVTLAGLVVFAVSVFAGGYTFWSKLAGHAERGWTSLMLSIWFIGGLTLFSLGLVGEYVGRIFLEVKRRPLYIVETAVLPDSATKHRERKMSFENR